MPARRPGLAFLWGTIGWMKGPLITVRCDCGNVHYVPYGETWRCERCGRRFDTARIPADEYWGIVREQRKMRFRAMAVAGIIVATFVTLGLTAGQRFFLMVPVALGLWFIFYMPQWRRKVRAAARSVPTWDLTPE
jgi:hypothetical protein